MWSLKLLVPWINSAVTLRCDAWEARDAWELVMLPESDFLYVESWINSVV